MNLDELLNELSEELKGIDTKVYYDPSEWRKVRGIAIASTDKAVLISGRYFKAMWIPRKYAYQVYNYKQELVNDIWYVNRKFLKSNKK